MQVNEGEISRIIRNVDLTDNCKSITFTEFLMAACNKNVLLNEFNLRCAFTYIDYDNDQFISREDFRKFLNIKNEYFIGNLIEEADDDCDGGLTFEEFSHVMNKILKGI